jgi:hypothetical protein
MVRVWKSSSNSEIYTKRITMKFSIMSVGALKLTGYWQEDVSPNILCLWMHISKTA